MNYPKNANLLCASRIFASLIASGAVCLASGDDIEVSSITRVQVFADRAYFLGTAATELETPMLVELPSGVPRPGYSERCLRVFGTPSKEHFQLNQRWSAFSDGIYCTLFGAALMRYQSADLDHLAAPCSGSDVPSTAKDGGKPPITSYAMLDPMVSARNRLVWDAPDSPRLLAKIPIVFYDIQAVDKEKIELFLTVDGGLTKWLFNGKEWRILKHYDFRLEGEFLAFDQGRSLVFERDGKWSVMRNIDDADSEVRALVNRVENEPLILVEDIVSQTNHFIDRDRLVDENGKEIVRLRQGGSRDRIRNAVQAVVDRRRP